MTPVGRIERKSLCKGCRQMKPAAQMIHAFGTQLFCSKGCVAKARWSMLPAPRKAVER